MRSIKKKIMKRASLSASFTWRGLYPKPGIINSGIFSKLLLYKLYSRLKILVHEPDYYFMYLINLYTNKYIYFTCTVFLHTNN